MEYKVNRRLKALLDPRTKLLLLLNCSIFVMGGAGEKWMEPFYWALVLLPLVLLLMEKKWKIFTVASLIYLCSYFARLALRRELSPLGSVLALTVYVITKILPTVVYARYMIATTKVSEFLMAMHKMHVTDKLTIPISVIFRFFPTIKEEYADINDAMRMRGVALGGGKAGEMLEYRLVPLIASCNSIGEELSAAAMTRGLEVGTKRSCIWTIGFGVFDYVMLAFCAACYIWWIVGRFFI